MIALTASQAALVFRVRPATLRKWVERGHIKRTPDGRYDATSILDHIDRSRHGDHLLDMQVSAVSR